MNRRYLGVVPGFTESPVFVKESDGTNLVELPVSLTTDESLVFIDGVIQRRYVDYWCVEEFVTFSENVPEGSQVIVRAISKEIYSTTQLSSNSVNESSFDPASYADSADIAAGVSNSLFIPPSALMELGLTKKETFYGLSNTGSVSQIFPHGLEEIPKLTAIRHRCVSADAGYSVGDVFHEGTWQYSADISNQYGTCMICTPSSVRITNGARRMFIPNKSTGVATESALNSWVIDVEIYA